MNEERAAGANSGALGTGRVNDQQNSKSLSVSNDRHVRLNRRRRCSSSCPVRW